MSGNRYYTMVRGLMVTEVAFEFRAAGVRITDNGLRLLDGGLRRSPTVIQLVK